jgi:hypothetical protein
MLAERLQLETVRRMSAVTNRDRLRGLAERREGGEGGGNLEGRRSNGVTASLGLDGADLVVEELAELPLHELLVRF